MTIDQIFSEVSAHMIEGLMIHSQLSDYFNFLGLKGYAKCHKYHFFEESCNYKKLNWYYLTHYNKLVEENPFKNPGIIPENWYQYTRQEVSIGTKKDALQEGFNKWIKWESETKELYENMYKQLITLGEIAGAKILEQYIIDVDNELAEAKQKHLELKAIGFDLSDIIQEQDSEYKKYNKKLREIDLC